MPNRRFSIDATVAVASLQAIALLIACGVGVAWHAEIVDLGDPLFLRPLCAFLLIQSLWSFVSWRLATGRWFDSYTIFLAAASIFNAGQAYLQVFQLIPLGLLEGRFSHASVVQAYLFITLGLMSLHLGALLAALHHSRTRPTVPVAGIDISNYDLRTIGYVLLAISLPTTLIVMANAFRAVVSGGYMALYSGEVSTGIFAIPLVLGTFLVPASVFLLAGSQDSRAGRWTACAVIAGNAAGQLFLGSRYHAIMPVVALAFVWHRCIRPLPAVPIVGFGVFLIAVVFPIIRETRTTSGEQRSVDSLTRAYSGVENPAVSSIVEMGGSAMITAYTMELVPTHRDYQLGRTYYYAALTLMPNVAWELHPSIAYGTPSNWLVWAVEPWLAARGGSFGFSFIAEAYLNFGWIGGPWFLALFGYFFGRLTLWAQFSGNQAAVRVALVASFINFVAFYAREEASLLVRPLVWYAFIPFAMVYLLAWSRVYFARRLAGRTFPGGTS